MTIKSISKNPESIRHLIRTGEFSGVTGGLAPGYVQANLVILPAAQAFDFLLFCQRNKRPCPLIEVLEPGQYEAQITTPGSDIRKDLPRYRIFRRGKLVDEVTDISNFWQNDLVSFLLGCSFTFESALIDSGIPLDHCNNNKNVSMWKTNLQCVPAGIFHGPMVVSMRPIHHSKVTKAVQVTSRFPDAHGAPLHIGNPSFLGITDITLPDYGEPSILHDGQVPMFWACGVTPQAVALESKPDFMITHSPGHMFITDMRDYELASL